MKAIIMYRPNSEHGRTVEEFAHEYMRRYPSSKLEIMSIDTREGSALASLYDVMSYPSILALRDDGSSLMQWQGVPLPLLDEVAGYASM